MTAAALDLSFRIEVPGMSAADQKSLDELAPFIKLLMCEGNTFEQALRGAPELRYEFVHMHKGVILDAVHAKAQGFHGPHYPGERWMQFHSETGQTSNADYVCWAHNNNAA